MLCTWCLFSVHSASVPYAVFRKANQDDEDDSAKSHVHLWLARDILRAVYADKFKPFDHKSKFRIRFLRLQLLRDGDRRRT
jgi:hypothetical protein